jgi:hypothetical protein
VPRGGAPAHPGYPTRGGVAAARHPQAGRGGYAYHPGYGYRPGYGGHYRPYYGGYHSGYPYYGYPYYRPYPYFSFSFGWPYAYSGWWPYGYSWPYYSPSYSVSYYGYRDEAPSRAYEAAPPLRSNRDTGRIRLEVRPEDASVYVDDEFWGNGRETKYLTLRSGRHSIELVRPGFEVARREVDVVRGETIDVLVELRNP